MSEVITPLIELPAGESFQNDTDDIAYIITEEHTLRDILRLLLTQTDAEEIEYLLLEMTGKL
jgi:hypothetical protein